MHPANYDESYLQELFDRMGPTYDFVNLISSFGFAEFWRRRCVLNAGVAAGEIVCDMMSGSGECWSYVMKRGASLVSVDFSRVMVQRQTRRKARLSGTIDVRCENVLRTSIKDGSMDCVVSAFGLKTLNEEGIRRFAREIRRVLKPGGRFSLLEISTAEGWWLSSIYRFYLRSIIPLIGKICLGDIECYRMLGVFTEEFGSCERIAPAFVEAGLKVSVRRHFYGCATSLVGSKIT